MASKRPTAAAKAAKKLATPVEPTMLLTLTEGQAEMVGKAMRGLAVAEAAVKERKETLQNLISMVRPEGANGFDPKTMTFYSVPQGEPKETPDA